MKYKVGDKVKIVSLQSRDRRDCRNVVGDIGVVVNIDSRECLLPYEVKIECGGRYWLEESNLELIEDTKPNTIKEDTEMNVTKAETTTPKFKKGDIVIRTGSSYEDGRMVEGNHYVVHSCIGWYVYLEDVRDGGELDWFGVDNFDLVKAYEDKPSTKFKKGDKVKVVGETRATGVNFGGIYTIKNPSDRTTDYCDGRKESYHVSLEEADGTPNEDCLELYIEPRNYRNMKPTDLINVSIDGFEDEIPLGDLIHTQALISNSTGRFGYKLYALLKAIDENGICRDVYSTIKVSDQQEKLMKEFFVIEAQKEADKANLKELISNKQNELKELQDKLNQLDN